MNVLKSHLIDQLRHMEWADSMVWSAVLEAQSNETSTAHLDDLLVTLSHIHLTQHSFLDAWSGTPFKRWKREDFETQAAFLSWAKEFYSAAFDFAESQTESGYDREMVIPWAKYFARGAPGGVVGPTTVGETIQQVVSHSMHHRGQVATRLRMHGATPPAMDYIIWLWLGRPSCVWPDSA